MAFFGTVPDEFVMIYVLLAQAAAEIGEYLADPGTADAHSGEVRERLTAIANEMRALHGTLRPNVGAAGSDTGMPSADNPPSDPTHGGQPIWRPTVGREFRRGE